jgi:hypothetical protein
MAYDIIVLQFKTVYVDGKERDMVLYAPKHSANSTQNWEYVHLLRPDESKLGRLNGETRNLKLAAMTSLWSQIEPHYLAWKKGYETPESGTSLRAWAGVNSAQVEALMRAHVRTVEELAAMPDHALPKVHLPGMHLLRQQANEYLANKDKSEIAKQLAEQKAANEAMAERLEAAMALIEEIKGAKDEAPKRGPGRPRKSVEDALTEDVESEAA